VGRSGFFGGFLYRFDYPALALTELRGITKGRTHQHPALANKPLLVWLLVLDDMTTMYRLVALALCAVGVLAQTWSPSNTLTSSASTTATQSASTTATLSATTTASPTASISVSPLPCPLRLFPNHDIIGTVLGKSFQPDEASCMLQCCNVADLCVGYSYNIASLGGATSGGTALARTLSDKLGISGSASSGYSLSPVILDTNPNLRSAFNSTVIVCGRDINSFNLGNCFRADRYVMNNDGVVRLMQPDVGIPRTASIPFGISEATCGDDYVRCEYDFSSGRYTLYINRGIQLGSEYTTYQLQSAGQVEIPASRVVSAQCVLLSNITQLIPSNGWNGGVKLSALGS
jgi:hypothetical protein